MGQIVKKKRQEQLFRECVEQHAGIVRRLSRAYAEDGEAEDLAQEIWLQAWSSLPRFRGGSRLSTWLYQLALNTGMAWRRKARKQPSTAEEEASIPDDSIPAPGRRQESRDERRLIREALNQFPDADRALVLLWLEGLSYREIGEISGLSESNVGVRLTRLKQKLKTLLEPYRNELG